MPYYTMSVTDGTLVIPPNMLRLHGKGVPSEGALHLPMVGNLHGWSKETSNKSWIRDDDIKRWALILGMFSV
jgi:hypothetical protein